MFFNVWSKQQKNISVFETKETCNNERIRSIKKEIYGILFNKLRKIKFTSEVK